MQGQPSQPIIVQLVREPVDEISVGDVIVGALGVTGVLVLLALALGGLLAVVLIRWKQRHPPEASHLPPVA